MGDASAIWVAISSLGASAEVRLNDVSIVKVAPQGWLEIAVTDGLQPFNELQIILEVSHPPRLGLIGDVGLEIAQ